LRRFILACAGLLACSACAIASGGAQAIAAGRSGSDAQSSAFALVGFLAFWSQIMQYGNCMNGASTVQTQSACQTQLQHAITARIKDFGG